MRTLYTSKIGLELVLPLILVAVIILLCTYNDTDSWVGIFFLIFNIVVIVCLFKSTKYIVDDDKLIIRILFFRYATIDIQSITAIRETMNPISAPATSIDRLEITYAPNNTVLISPKRKHEFIQHLTTLNPNISVQLKKK